MLMEHIRMPRVIGLAGGHEKVEAVLGALRGRYIDILITDELTGIELLERNEGCSAETH